MKPSLIVAALLVGSMLASAAVAQNTNTNAAGSLSNATGVGTAVNGPINNADNSTSAANSTSNGTGVGIASVAPISNNSNTTSAANSNSGANSNSLATGGTGGNANATGGNANSGAANAANSQNTNLTVESNTVIPRDTTSRFAPQVVASGLTTSNDTCMGSTSAGLTIIGGGGTVGTTWDDKACNRRQNSARLYAMGWRQESCEVMMDDPTVKAAFERTGRHCVDMAENDVAPPPPPPPPVLQQLPPPPPAPAQAVPLPPQGERGKNDQPPPADQQASLQTSIDSILGGWDSQLH